MALNGPAPPSCHTMVTTMAVNDQKAGMQGLDKEKINKIIHQASKGTNYHLHQIKRQQRIDKRVEEMECSLNDVTDAQRRLAKKQMDDLAEEMKASRDLSRVIVHVDMDAFYAAVEIRDDPTLRDKPVAVGAMSMLSTSNYLARTYGVRAAMPGFIAKKLCPHLIIVPPNFVKYISVSEQVSAVLREYTPNLVMMSLDEGYLDITDHVIMKCSTPDDLGCVIDSVVEEIRSKIFSATNLTASAGIAANMMLAKVCSDRNKPNGQYKLPSNVEAIEEFISDLPVRKISGIGPVQDQLFAKLGIQTCADLWEKREILPILFSSTSARFYLRSALGLGSTCVRLDGNRKSIGTEVSFQELNTPESLHEMCRDLCYDLAEDLVEKGIVGKVVVLKMKTVKFDVATRNATLALHTSKGEIIYRTAKRLLDREIASVKPGPLRLRLMGIRLQSLTDAHEETWKQRLLPIETVRGDVIDANGENSSVGQPKDVSAETSNGAVDVSDKRTACPVCGRRLDARDLLEVNRHVDNCLSGQTVRELLSETSQSKRKSVSKPVASKKSKTCNTTKTIASYFQVQNQTRALKG